MIAEKIIKDSRPFSDPTHPIHEHPSVKPHPEDYAAPSSARAERNLKVSPIETEVTEWMILRDDQPLRHGDQVNSPEAPDQWFTATSRDAMMRAQDKTLRFRRHISQCLEMIEEDKKRREGHLGVTLTDNGTMIVDGIEMSVQFVKQFLTNADGKHLFAFKRDGDRMMLTQISDAKSAKEYFTAQDFS